MILLDGKKISLEIKKELKEKIARERERTGRKPGLGIIQVGKEVASSVYVNSQIKGSKTIGIETRLYSFDKKVSEEVLLKKIEELNQTEEIDGIILQLPLPDHISRFRILQAISVNKDVDGFKTENMGRLHLGEEGFNPCTPEGVMTLLKRYHIPIAGKNVTILGRSNIVGKPMLGLFVNHDATVTICNSLTKNLKEHTQNADILVVAIGKPGFITADMVKKDAVVVDVGINRNEEGKIVGDVSYEEVASKASYITPVPGGVGSMTVAMLFQNIWKAFMQNRGGRMNKKKKDEKKQYYIVDKSILPVSIQKVIAVNEMVKSEHISKYEGIRRIGLSRSTYYKYKDYIKPFFEGSQEKIFNIHMSLKDIPGLLAKILEVIAKDSINILTIVQNVAVDGIVQLTLSLQSTSESPKNIEGTLENIQKIHGVVDLRILGSNV